MNEYSEMIGRIRQSQEVSTVSSQKSDADEWEEIRCKVLNDSVGNLTELVCDKCRNKGVIYYASSGYIRVRDCECMPKRRIIRRMERSGLKNLLTDYSFATWQTPEEWQKKVKAIAERYVNEKNGWFVTAGRSGSGKTHICTAICGALLDLGLDVRYMLWRDDAVSIKASVTDSEEYERKIDPLKTVKVLYIDDLFKVGDNAKPSAADLSLAFEILNARYNDRSKLTIISTERSIDELIELDEAVGSRIYERAKGWYLDFGNKQNWRTK